MTQLLAAIGMAAALTSAEAPRVRYTINDQWRYAAGPIDGTSAPDFDDSGWQRINLPHTWNATDAFDKTAPYRRGIGWYRKSLAIAPDLRGKRLFLYFEGANQVADVFVNGRHAGQHIGGYTAFVFEITDSVQYNRPNIAAVRVDNSHNPDIPPLNADFTFYGGIYRDVWLLATSSIHIAVTDYASPGVFVSTEPRGTVRIAGTIANQSDQAAHLRVISSVIDAEGAVVASIGVCALSPPMRPSAPTESSRSIPTARQSSDSNGRNGHDEVGPRGDQNDVEDDDQHRRQQGAHVIAHDDAHEGESAPPPLTNSRDINVARTVRSGALSFRKFASR